MTSATSRLRATASHGATARPPFLMPAAVPHTATGSTGTPASMASRKAPDLNGSSRASRERVPSGKIITFMPRAR